MKKWLKSMLGFFVLIIIIFLFFLQLIEHNFDEKTFNPNNINKNTENLLSINDNDRQAIFITEYFKGIGISPAGDNGTYYQNFKTITPVKAADTPNILGKIEGTDKSAGYLIISSHLDGDAKGTALMMELARDIKLQKFKPSKTIVFAVWNSFNEGMKGSKYYVDNPIFPLGNSEVVVIDNIDSTSGSPYLSTFGTAGKALMGKLTSYADNNGIVTLNDKANGNDTEAFLLKDIPAVLMQGDIKDNSIGTILVNYLHRDVYQDWFHGLFSYSEVIFISILIITMLLVHFFKLLYKLRPDGRFFKIQYESIYYSTIFIIIDKLTKLVLTVILALFLISCIVYIPRSFDVVKYNNRYMSNYSIYIILQNAVEYIRGFAVHGFGKSLQGFSIATVIGFSIFKSLTLILCSITLAFIIGTFSGTLSGFKRKGNSSIGFLGSIALLSLPDVLVTILLLMLCDFLYKYFPTMIGINEICQFIFPLICLTFIPTAYISRIAQTAVREEINKDYIIAAKAKGLSNFNIIKDHLLISVVIKVVEALPSVLTIIISNLIIVEYFFAYVGIVYLLFDFFKAGDIKTSIGLIIGLGIAYIIMILILKLIAIMINPFKRRSIVGGHRYEKA